MTLVQNMWDNRNLPTEQIGNISVFLSKVNKDTRGIDLLEVLRKTTEAVIDTRVKTAVQLHDVLHGFCAC